MFQPCVFMDQKLSQCSIVNLKDPAALPKTFTFDGTYYTDSTTEQIYNEIAYPLVEVCSTPLISCKKLKSLNIRNVKKSALVMFLIFSTIFHNVASERNLA